MCSVVAAVPTPPIRRSSNCRGSSRSTRWNSARIVSDDQIEAIHRQSLKVLEEIGMDVLLPEARDILQKAGARVDGERVRIGRDIIEEALKTPPAEFTFHARNPAHNIRVGGKWIAFAPVGGPPNCSDLDRGRRPGTLEDAGNFVKLSQFFNTVHTAGGASVDALDVHASIRHLHITRNKMVYSDKVPFVYATGRARLFDGVEIVRLARGISHEQLLQEPSVYTVINTNSPLKLDMPDGHGHHRDGAAEPDRGGHTLHAAGRHGAGDAGRRHGGAECRSAGGARAVAARAGPARPSSMAASPRTST